MDEDIAKILRDWSLGDYIDTFKDLKQNVLWLQNSTEPWELVEKKWKSETTIRTTELNTTDKSVTEYMKEFPALQKPAGYQLLILDFKNLYPEKENLLYENFSVLKDNLLIYADKKSSRDPALKEILQVQETLCDMEDVKASEVKTLLALLTLPLLLGNPLGKGRKTSWRFV